ncbi:MAG: hypothetical protein IKT57_05560 [Clostridia bacterium]|nr:hypothetical protein [Clostridia bacterium]
MKKLLAMLLVLVLVLGTCLAENEQAVYQHTSAGFSFTLPTGWELESESADGCLMTAHDEQVIIVVERTNVGAVVSHEDFLSIYAPMLLATYAQEYPGMETLQESEIVTVGDQEYIRQVIAMEIEGVPVTMEMNYQTEGTYMYILGFTVQEAIEEAKLELVAEETELVLASFVTAGGAAQTSASGNLSAAGETSASGSVSATGGTSASGSVSASGSISASGSVSATGENSASGSASAAGNVSASGSVSLTGNVSAAEEEIVAEEEPAAEEEGTEAPAAMKENAPTYTNERGGYSFSYPADMLLMSQDNVQDMLDNMTSEGYGMEGMDATVLQQNAEQIRRTDMTMLMYAGGVFNYNVVYQNVGITLNNELVLSALCPNFITQYQAIYPGLEMLDEGSMYTVGGKEYVTQSLQVKVNGMDMTIVILYAVNGTYLYNVTFTVADMAMTDEMTDYVNGAVALFAESFEAFAPTAQ